VIQGKTMAGKGKTAADVQKILDDPGNQQTLVVLFIPSHDGQDEKPLPSQDVWADNALELFAEIFGGATAFSTYAGIYRDKTKGRDLRDKPILIESYASVEHVNDEKK
jgi:hypothetical protein